MQATPIGLDMIRKVAVESGAVKPDCRLITERDVPDPAAVISVLCELMQDYERYSK